MDNHSNNIYDIAIIGAGAAGMMAALRGVLNNDNVLLFGGSAKDKKRSRAQWVTKVENIPGFNIYKRGVLDPNKETLKFIEYSPFSKNLNFLKNTGVEEIIKQDNIFQLTTDKGEIHKARYVLLATGVMDVQPEIEGSIKTIFPYANVQSVDYCIRCDGHHVLGKETAVIGSSEDAAWVAILLHERYSPPNLTILTDGKIPSYSENVQKLLKHYHIDVITSGLDGVNGDIKEGQLKGFTFCNGSYLPVDFAFVGLGMLVYNKLATSLGTDTDERGFVTTNNKGESSIEGLYVAGDLRANTKKQIYTAWDTAVDSIDDINAKIRRTRRIEILNNS